MEPVFTIGHGTRSTEDIADMARSAGVATIVDVRRYPGSRRHPHLAREQLANDLPALGVGYEWWGDALGGRRSRVGDSRNVAWRNASFRGYADHMASDAFRGALDDLRARAEKERVAVMCAETLWWNCHRRLIADALTLRGTEVVHLLDAGKSQRHPLHPAARVDEGGGVVYDLGETPRLDL